MFEAGTFNMTDKDTVVYETKFDKAVAHAEEVLKTFDEVNHPPHYNTGKIEVIEFIEDQKLDFHCGNAVKYIARAGKKDPLKEGQDISKAIWYLRRRLEVLSGSPRRPNEMNE